MHKLALVAAAVAIAIAFPVVLIVGLLIIAAESLVGADTGFGRALLERFSNILDRVAAALVAAGKAPDAETRPNSA